MRGEPHVSGTQREDEASHPVSREPAALGSDEGQRICTPVPGSAGIRRVRRPAREDGKELSGQVRFTGRRDRSDGNSWVILRIWRLSRGDTGAADKAVNHVGSKSPHTTNCLGGWLAD